MHISWILINKKISAVELFDIIMYFWYPYVLITSPTVFKIGYYFLDKFSKVGMWNCKQRRTCTEQSEPNNNQT